MRNDALGSDLLSANRKHREQVVGDTEVLRAPLSRNFKTGSIDFHKETKGAVQTVALAGGPPAFPACSLTLKKPFALSLSISSLCVLPSQFCLLVLNIYL